MWFLDFLKGLLGVGNHQATLNQRPKNPCERLIREVVRQMKEKGIEVPKSVHDQMKFVIKVDFLGQFKVELPEVTLEFRQSDDEWTRHTCMPLITEIKSQMENHNIQVPKSIPKQMEIVIQVNLKGQVTVILAEGYLTLRHTETWVFTPDKDELMLDDLDLMKWRFIKNE